MSCPPSNTGSSTSQSADPALSRRCVMLVPPGCAADSQLLVGLSHRRVRVAVVQDIATVMLQLAAEPTHALILVDPQRHPRLTELLDAVHAYHRRVSLWSYQAPTPQHHHRQLAPLRSDHASQNPIPPQPTPATADTRPAPPDRDAPPQPDHDVEPLITDEELAMLLDDTPGQAHQPNER